MTDACSAPFGAAHLAGVLDATFAVSPWERAWFPRESGV